MQNRRHCWRISSRFVIKPNHYSIRDSSRMQEMACGKPWTASRSSKLFLPKDKLKHRELNSCSNRSTTIHHHRLIRADKDQVSCWNYKNLQFSRLPELYHLVTKEPSHLIQPGLTKEEELVKVVIHPSREVEEKTMLR